MNTSPTAKADAIWGKILGWGAFVLFLCIARHIVSALPKGYPVYKVAALEPSWFGLTPLILLGLISVFFRKDGLTATIVAIVVVLAILNLISAICAYAAAMSGGTFPSQILDHVWMQKQRTDPREINLWNFLR